MQCNPQIEVSKPIELVGFRAYRLKRMLSEVLYLSGLLAATTALLHVYFGKRDAKKVYAGKHVVVTGGSQGIGRVLAEELVLIGANVTIMARTVSKLEVAKAEIEKRADGRGGKVDFVAVDVTNYQKVQAAMSEAEKKFGDIASAFLCTGRAQPGYFLEQDPKIFQESMDQNYLSAVYCAKVIADKMVNKHVKGEIVLISSAAACASFIGYSSYAPTKSALRAFSDALRNELKGFGIKIRIAYPPDTDTPGFEEENKTKPKETLEVSPPEAYPAKDVADSIIEGCLRDEYHLRSPDAIQNFLVSTSVNITPRGRFAALEIALAPVLAIAMLIFNFHADRIAVTYGKRVVQALRAK